MAISLSNPTRDNPYAATGQPGMKAPAPAATATTPIASVPIAPRPVASMPTLPPPPSINVAPKPTAGALPLTMPGSLGGAPRIANEPDPHALLPGGQMTAGQRIQPGAGGGIRAAAAPSTAAAPAPRSIGAVPYANLSSFGPGGDLRGTQIAPGGNTVDRFGLAQQRYDQFMQHNQPGDFQAVRDIASRAASAGRLGSGMVDQSYNELARTEADRNATARSGFLTDALQGTIQDASDQRNELRTERGYQEGTAQQSIQNRVQQQQLEEQLRSGQFGRGVQQTELEEMLRSGQFGRSVQQKQLEESLTQGDYNRTEGRAMDQAGLGYQNNPWQALLAGSGQQQAQAGGSGSALAELLRQYSLGRSSDPNLDAYGRPAAAPSQGQLGPASNYHFPSY